MLITILQIFRKNFIVQILTYFVPIVIIVGSMAAYFYYSEKINEQGRIAYQEASIVKMSKASIQRALESTNSDLLYLSNQYDFKQLSTTFSSTRFEHLSDDYKLIMKSRMEYEQIRWIDENGMEKLRVNYKDGEATLVPKNQLQYKGDRYYFIEAMELTPTQIYYSRFDLNIEKNKIEIPFKPTIRIATPIIDNNGKKRGILVVNYLANQLIKRFRETTVTSNGISMLLNSDGYWLKGEKAEDEWGFMLKRYDLTMANAHPSAWKRIQGKEKGQFENDEGLWTFETVYPLADNKRVSTGIDKGPHPSQNLTENRHYFWKAVTFIPTEKLYTNTDYYFKLIFIVTLFILVMTWIVLWKFIHYAKKTEKLSSVINQIDDAIVITDEMGIITYVNQAFCAHTEYTKDEVLGKSSSILKSGKHGSLFYERLWETILSGKIFRGTVINKKKNGDVYYEDKTITPLKDDKNNIIGFVSSGKDVTMETLIHQEIEQIASTDKLTGIHNRHKFEEIYNLEAERVNRSLQPLSLLLIDIDHFKLVNDTYGHDIGDEVLKTLTDIVKKNIRKIDIFARWGGEEFLVLSPSTDFENIQILAEKLRLAVEDTVFPTVGHVTISIGISTFKENDTFSDLFKRADQGLYCAKEHGRNQLGTVV